jgi:hypothetical protein
MRLTKAGDFDPDFNDTPAEWARMYRACGLQIVPSRTPSEGGNWKRPALANWITLQEEMVPDATFERWYSRGGEHYQRRNMGLLTGRASGNVWVLDLDEYKPGALDWWRGVLAVHNNGIEPETWQQTTGGGGRQILFVAPKDFTVPTNKTSVGVDIRGQGGFAVLPPSMHSSGKEYAWKPGYAPWEVDVADAPQWLLDAIVELIARYGGKEATLPLQPSTPGVVTPTPPSEMDAFGLRVDGRDHYMRDLVWAAVVNWYRECPIEPTRPESIKRMDDAYASYLRNTKSRLPGEQPNEVKLEQERRGYSAFQDKWHYAMKQWGGDVARAAAVPQKEKGQILSEERTPVGPLQAHPHIWTDPKSIPPRSWLYGRHYIRKFVSCTVAPGGSGKSSLALAEALAMASGKALLGQKPVERVKVWLWNLEDPLEETQRRVAAACLHFKLTPADLDGWLFIDSGREMPLVLAETQRDGTKLNTEQLAALQATIEAKGIGCLIVDPFVSSHRVTENDNNAIEVVVKAFARVADHTDCAIGLIHHTRKTNGEEATVEDGRGASALLAAARSARVVNTMSEKTGAEVGVENHRFYFSLQNGKGNMAPPPNKADWFKLASVTLGNGRGLYPEGDHVAVVEAWKFPDPAAAITALDFDKAAAMIRSGSWRLDWQCENWVGVAVANALDLDLDKPTEKATVKAAIGMWLRSGSLVVVERRDAKRMLKKHVEVAPS